ncbi:MAG: SAM-dependent methyltransferase [Bacteroidales bacterium]|jgi:16S rRNA (cytidine1402-2'-O)-methyltransferase|nr:SAM-dependent methyltransferase [Bacteroidales bacterium]
MKGTLYLIPSPIGEPEVYNCTPRITASIIITCQAFIVEDIRTAWRFLRKAGFNRKFEEVPFFELNKHTNEEEIPSFIQPLLEGKNMALLSEAGMPCIADPGYQVVAIAHAKRIKVVPLVGPCSITMALMSSGFCGQNFAFTGYLPIEGKLRDQAIRKLEHIALTTGQSQIFIEAPYRNNRLFASLLKVLQPTTMLCIATDLMLTTEHIISQPVSSWLKQNININKRNSVFIIGNENYASQYIL